MLTRLKICTCGDSNTEAPSDSENGTIIEGTALVSNLEQQNNDRERSLNSIPDTNQATSKRPESFQSVLSDENAGKTKNDDIISEEFVNCKIKEFCQKIYVVFKHILKVKRLSRMFFEEFYYLINLTKTEEIKEQLSGKIVSNVIRELELELKEITNFANESDNRFWEKMCEEFNEGVNYLKNYKPQKIN